MCDNNIILIGFMGSGKTTIGMKLSYKLKQVFCDTDKMIELREKRSISAIFEERGEAFFRQKETELLTEMAADESKPCSIISVGGGTPLRTENRELLKKLGIVIYLQVSPETVYDRLKGDITRPLLQSSNPLEKIQGLLKERTQVYESVADFIVNCDYLTMNEIVNNIADLVKKY